MPLLGQIPIDPRLREGGDAGWPLVAAVPDSDAARALSSVADALARRQGSLLGRSLGLSAAVPLARFGQLTRPAGVD